MHVSTNASLHVYPTAHTTCVTGILMRLPLWRSQGYPLCWCSEDAELRGDVADSIYEAAKLMVEMEHKYIDKIFEMGDIENLTAIDLKNFIYRRTNEKLQELGLKPVFEYDEKSADNLDWFYHLTGGHTHTDFFAIRPTDYAKAGEGDDWDDIW